jgi:hypothetical protein
VKLEADVLGAPLNQSVELTLPERETSNPEIERMWASHRVERLMASDRETGSVGTSKDEIVRLCEGYSIASEYASFIVLENDAEYQRWSIKRRNATRVTRDRSAQVALRKELDQIRELAVTKLGPDQSGSQRSVPVAKSDPSRFSTSMPSGPTTSNPPAIDPPRARDISMPSANTRGGGGGGGAIDPISAAIALGLAGASMAAARYGRRKQSP